MIRTALTLSVRLTRSASFPLATLLLLGAPACSSDDSTAPPAADAASDGSAQRDATSEAVDSGVRDADASLVVDTGRDAADPRDVVRVDEASIDTGSVEASVDAAPVEPPDAAGDAPAAQEDATEPMVDAGVDAAPLGLRLVGYWKFDELSGTAAVDSSGNSNDGTLTTGATLVAGGTPATQYPNPGSLQVDGAGGTAVLGVNGFPAVDAPKTISLWVNYPAIPGPNMTILALTNSTQACGVQLGLRGGNIAVSSWGGGLLVNNAGAPPAGAWHNVVYTFDGTTNSLYIDGAAPVTRVTAPQSCATIENVVGTWATHAPPYDEFYAGMVDDLRIYSGVLGAAQIAALAAGADPSLVSPEAGVDAAPPAPDAAVDATAEAAADGGADAGAGDAPLEASTADGAAVDGGTD